MFDINNINVSYKRQEHCYYTDSGKPSVEISMAKLKMYTYELIIMNEFILDVGCAADSHHIL